MNFITHPDGSTELVSFIVWEEDPALTILEDILVDLGALEISYEYVGAKEDHMKKETEFKAVKTAKEAKKLRNDLLKLVRRAKRAIANMNCMRTEWSDDYFKR